MWTKDAQKISGTRSWSNALTACNTLIYPEMPNEDYFDWRLPNRSELITLIDIGESSPALPSGHIFDNVQSSYYWTSSTYKDDTDKAWVVNMSDGSVTVGDKTLDNYYVLPVRSSQWP